MRKFFNTLTAVALTALAAIGFTACGGDDDDDDPTIGGTLQMIEWDVEADLEGDAAKIFDYSVTIALPNGETQKMTGTKVRGELYAKQVSLPALFTVTIERTVKPGFTYAEGDKASWKEDISLDVELYDTRDIEIMQKETGWNHETNQVDLSQYLPAKGDQTSVLTLTVKKTSTGYTIE